ncbi:hypothetical protein VL20_5512 [Microcystis panniformis FACHB-1757]|uniref:Uncharacterized protein n=1 Tax=Microcystis panniformis FACHB-1757 TaxID=1638788 RepID=A0A0K1S8I2_9CHRO|nr:hypothetical protein VL20_5512 [Microcystis panniformis FACHB-1757]
MLSPRHELPHLTLGNRHHWSEYQFFCFDSRSWLYPPGFFCQLSVISYQLSDVSFQFSVK